LKNSLRPALKFEMAKVSFEVTSNDASFIECLTDNYRNFLSKGSSDQAPDLKIEVALEKNQRQQESSRMKNRGRWLANTITTKFDFMGKTAEIKCDRQEKFFFACLPDFGKNINSDVFNSYVLPFALHEVIKIRGLFHYLIHAAAVAFAEEGYVFVGPSGSGKSTLIRLILDDSNFNGQVLNDELIILSNTRDECLIYGTPYGDGLSREHQGEPDKGFQVKAIFGLKQDNRVFLEKLNSAEAMRMLLSQTIPHLDLEHAEVREMPDFLKKAPLIAEDWLVETFNLVKKIPCYNLHFSLDHPCWTVIKNS